MGNYDKWMQLWKRYCAGLEDHDCGDECLVCDASWAARRGLVSDLSSIVMLLERYHDILQDLSNQVIQEVPLPRNEKLQLAMLKALTILDQDGGGSG